MYIQQTQMRYIPHCVCTNACLHAHYVCIHNYVTNVWLYYNSFFTYERRQEKNRKKKKPLSRDRRSFVGKPVYRNTWGIVCCNTLLILYIFKSCFFFLFFSFLFKKCTFLPFTFVDVEPGKSDEYFILH